MAYSDSNGVPIVIGARVRMGKGEGTVIALMPGHPNVHGHPGELLAVVDWDRGVIPTPWPVRSLTITEGN